MNEHRRQRGGRAARWALAVLVLALATFVLLRGSGGGPKPRGSGGGPKPRGKIAVNGITYYVSASGSDSNAGTSRDSAWRTVGRVNRAQLKPGDGVLFEGGATFPDQTLTPSSGGASGGRILFGSYGHGRASLPRGVFFKNLSHVAFHDLIIVGPEQGIDGFGNDVVVEHCSIAKVRLAIQSHGSNWLIEHNEIDHTGDSGLLLYGNRERVSDNTISNTGLDNSIPYGKHGIYLKAPNSIVTGNTITNFSEDGVSVRYRNTVVTGNRISGGAVGIAWFQYDSVPGTSRFTGNSIIGTTAAGIYVSSIEAGTETIERFVIAHNKIRPSSGVNLNIVPIGHVSAR